MRKYEGENTSVVSSAVGAHLGLQKAIAGHCNRNCTNCTKLSKADKGIKRNECQGAKDPGAHSISGKCAHKSDRSDGSAANEGDHHH